MAICEMARLVTALLQRTNEGVPWGFRIQGGADYNQPLSVQRVTRGSIASQFLDVDDMIIMVEGQDARLMCHFDACELIKMAGNSVELIVRKANSKYLCQENIEQQEKLEQQIVEQRCKLEEDRKLRRLMKEAAIQSPVKEDSQRCSSPRYSSIYSPLPSKDNELFLKVPLNKCEISPPQYCDNIIMLPKSGTGMPGPIFGPPLFTEKPPTEKVFFHSSSHSSVQPTTHPFVIEASKVQKNYEISSSTRMRTSPMQSPSSTSSAYNSHKAECSKPIDLPKEEIDANKSSTSSITRQRASSSPQKLIPPLPKTIFPQRQEESANIPFHRCSISSSPSQRLFTPITNQMMSQEIRLAAENKSNRKLELPYSQEGRTLLPQDDTSWHFIPTSQVPASYPFHAASCRNEKVSEEVADPQVFTMELELLKQRFYKSNLPQHKPNKAEDGRKLSQDREVRTVEECKQRQLQKLIEEKVRLEELMMLAKRRQTISDESHDGSCTQNNSQIQQQTNLKVTPETSISQSAGVSTLCNTQQQQSFEHHQLLHPADIKSFESWHNTNPNFQFSSPGQDQLGEKKEETLEKETFLTRQDHNNILFGRKEQRRGNSECRVEPNEVNDIGSSSFSNISGSHGPRNHALSNRQYSLSVVSSYEKNKMNNQGRLIVEELKRDQQRIQEELHKRELKRRRDKKRLNEIQKEIEILENISKSKIDFFRKRKEGTRKNVNEAEGKSKKQKERSQDFAKKGQFENIASREDECLKQSQSLRERNVPGRTNLAKTSEMSMPRHRFNHKGTTIENIGRLKELVKCDKLKEVEEKSGEENILRTKKVFDCKQNKQHGKDEEIIKGPSILNQEEGDSFNKDSAEKVILSCNESLEIQRYIFANMEEEERKLLEEIDKMADKNKNEKTTIDFHSAVSPGITYAEGFPELQQTGDHLLEFTAEGEEEMKLEDLKTQEEQKMREEEKVYQEYKFHLEAKRKGGRYESDDCASELDTGEEDEERLECVGPDLKERFDELKATSEEELYSAQEKSLRNLERQIRKQKIREMNGNLGKNQGKRAADNSAIMRTCSSTGDLQSRTRPLTKFSPDPMEFGFRPIENPQFGYSKSTGNLTGGPSASSIAHVAGAEAGIAAGRRPNRRHHGHKKAWNDEPDFKKENLCNMRQQVSQKPPLPCEATSKLRNAASEESLTRSIGQRPSQNFRRHTYTEGEEYSELTLLDICDLESIDYSQILREYYAAYYQTYYQSYFQRNQEGNMNYGPPPPPPPPPFPTGAPLPVKLPSEIAAMASRPQPVSGPVPPAALAGAMLKDKKPFTYTPGGINLAEIKSPRMQRRLRRNASLEGVGPSPLAQQPPTPTTPAGAPAFIPSHGMIQVLPVPGIGMAPVMKRPATKDPPPPKRSVCGPAPLPPPFVVSSENSVDPSPSGSPYSTPPVSFISSTSTSSQDIHSDSLPADAENSPSCPNMMTGEAKTTLTNDDPSSSTSIPPPPPLPTGSYKKIARALPLSGLQTKISPQEVSQNSRTSTNRQNKEDQTPLLFPDVATETTASSLSSEDRPSSSNILTDSSKDTTNSTECTESDSDLKVETKLNIDKNKGLEYIVNKDKSFISPVDAANDKGEQSHYLVQTDKSISDDKGKMQTFPKENRTSESSNPISPSSEHTETKEQPVQLQKMTNEFSIPVFPLDLAHNIESTIIQSYSKPADQSSVKIPERVQKGTERQGMEEALDSEIRRNVTPESERSAGKGQEKNSISDNEKPNLKIYGNLIKDDQITERTCNDSSMNSLPSETRNEHKVLPDRFIRQTSLPAHSSSLLPDYLSCNNSVYQNSTRHAITMENKSSTNVSPTTGLIKNPMPWMCAMKKEMPPPEFLAQAQRTQKRLERQRSFPQNDRSRAPYTQKSYESNQILDNDYSPHSIATIASPPPVFDSYNAWNSHQPLSTASRASTIPTATVEPQRNYSQQIPQSTNIDHNRNPTERIIPIMLDYSPPITPLETKTLPRYWNSINNSRSSASSAPLFERQSYCPSSEDSLFSSTDFGRSFGQNCDFNNCSVLESLQKSLDRLNTRLRNTSQTEPNGTTFTMRSHQEGNPTNGASVSTQTKSCRVVQNPSGFTSQQNHPDATRSGSSIPSRSFRMLQAMTDSNDDVQSDDGTSPSRCSRTKQWRQDNLVKQTESFPMSNSTNQSLSHSAPSIPTLSSSYTSLNGSQRDAKSRVTPSYTTTTDSPVYRQVVPRILKDNSKEERVVNGALSNNRPKSPSPWHLVQSSKGVSQGTRIGPSSFIRPSESPPALETTLPSQSKTERQPLNSETSEKRLLYDGKNIPSRIFKHLEDYYAKENLRACNSSPPRQMTEVHIPRLLQQINIGEEKRSSSEGNLHSYSDTSHSDYEDLLKNEITQTVAAKESVLKELTSHFDPQTTLKKPSAAPGRVFRYLQQQYDEPSKGALETNRVSSSSRSSSSGMPSDIVRSSSSASTDSACDEMEPKPYSGARIPGRTFKLLQENYQTHPSVLQARKY